MRRLTLLFILVFIALTATAAQDETLTNTNWTPIIRKFDGVEMVFVPAGCFDMGSSTGQPDELPVHEICFDKPFWIDRTEVTNAQYGESGYFAGDDLPREGVSLIEAAVFCKSRDARLPTEAEWEYAARGPESWQYPWGDDFDGIRVNFCDANCDILDRKDDTIDDGYTTTAPVGSYPDGASWVGALDMSGNLWEWTSSRYDSYPYDVNDGREGLMTGYTLEVLRGGGWDNTRADVRAADRIGYLPRNAVNNVGFRCLR
jgi:formylglycine-generating enzyme required for sulfatase activity